MASRFKNKVKAAAVKYVPDGVGLTLNKTDGRWHAHMTSDQYFARAEAKGLMDCIQKVCKAWHEKAGTNLVKLVRDAEKKAKQEQA